MHKLLIQDDEGKTTVVPLIRDEITIGRKEGNTIRLTERNVSRKHARIVRNNGTIAIEDLGSYNGVKVNGSRIQGRVGIALSDRIQIGDYLLELKLDNAPATIGVQPTVPINSVAPPPVAVTPAVPVAQEEAPTTKISDEVMREVGHTSIPPAAQPVPAAASSPALPTAEPSVAPVPAPGAIPVQPQTTPKQTGRMVILSRNFAGREYVLDRPALVIGRTEDNDVVINHRSISRHHAKVVLENGRYAIVDLQSSNGVRVNGEEYGKVELRRGDIIDLGHVRIRFVEPGESFVFTPSMAVDVGSGGGGKTLWLVLAALIVGAAGIGVFAFSGGDDDDGEEAQKSKPAAVVQDAAPKPDKPTTPDKPIDNDELLRALEKAEEASNDKKWAQAKEAAEQALAIEPGNDKATALAEQAARELDNLERFQELKKLSKVRRNKDYARIAEVFTEITVESVYKDDARKLHDAAKKKYSDASAQRAKQLIRGRKCDQLRTLASDAEQIWEDVGALVEAEVARCEAAVAARNTDRTPNRRPKNNDTNDTTNDKKPNDTTNNDTANTNASNNTSRKPRKSFKEYMNEAETAAKSGQYGVALRACRNALKQRSSDMQALTTCAVASCRLKRAEAAKRYINRISAAKRRGMLKQVCLRNGVEVP